MDQAQLTKLLYTQRAPAREEVKAAGGLQAFCRTHSGKLQFVQDDVRKGAGEVRLLSSKQPLLGVVRSEESVAEGGRERSGADVEGRGEASGALAASVGEDVSMEKEAGAAFGHASRPIMGKITAMFPQFAFMESMPGVAD
eukprot:3006677-Rhodomonas_salina.1